MAGFVAADEFVDATDDGAGAAGLFGALVEGLGDFPGVSLSRGDQVGAANVVAGNGRQGLVQFMGKAGGHLPHGNESGSGLQALLPKATEFLGVFAIGDVHDGTHPAALLSGGVDEGGLMDQGPEVFAIAATELNFEVVLRPVAGKDAIVQGEGGVDFILDPIGHGRQASHQLLPRPADHAAKSIIDVGDASLQIPGPQAGLQGVFHGCPKSVFLPQGFFRLEAALNMAA